MLGDIRIGSVTAACSESEFSTPDLSAYFVGQCFCIKAPDAAIVRVKTDPLGFGCINSDVYKRQEVTYPARNFSGSFQFILCDNIFTKAGANVI